jgi:glycosyltransferase involved in cell wall biosynthesis
VPTVSRINGPLGWWLSKRGGWRTATTLLGEWNLWALGPPNARNLQPALEQTAADVVVSVNWGSAVPLAVEKVAHERGLPIVGVPLFHVGRPWAERALHRTLLSRATMVLTMTSAEAEFVTARGARLVEVVGNGVDPADFENPDRSIIRDRHGLGDDPVVGFVGRQDEGKGVPELFDAMREVWKTHPRAHLVLAGQARHRDATVTEKLAELHGEGARIVLLDDFSAADAPHIFAACDVLALPSVEESFGLVFLEAWMCGTPVVGCRIPAVERVIDDGEDGLLVEPGDAADLARALLEILASPERGRQMAAIGRTKVLARHTWDMVTDRWEAALARAARLRRSGAGDGATRGAAPR